MNACLFLVVLTMLAAGEANNVREKRQLRDAWTCMSKTAGILSQCNDDLGERSKAVRDADLAGDVSTCCYFVAYRQCVAAKAAEVCGDGIGDFVDRTIRGVQGALVDKCSDFDYLTPSCIFVLYYPWIIIASVILVLVGIGCCLGACCCR